MKDNNWKEQIRSNPVPGVVNKPGVNIQDLIKRIEELEKSNKVLVEQSSLDMIRPAIDKAVDKEVELLKSALSKIEELESRISKLEPQSKINKPIERPMCTL